MTFHLTSPAFESGEDIPTEFTCDGPDSSPSLIWNDPPPGTEALALIVASISRRLGPFLVRLFRRNLRNGGLPGGWGLGSGAG